METTPQTPEQPQFLTVREAAKRLRIHEVTLRRLADHGAIPVARVGGKVLVPASYLTNIEAAAVAGMRPRRPVDMPVEDPATEPFSRT